VTGTGQGFLRVRDVPLRAITALRDAGARVEWRGFLIIPALHLMMFLNDVAHPDRFLNADRALERIQVIEAFGMDWKSGGDISAFFAAHGIPGDWFVQGLLYLCGGQYLVIAVQAALAVLSVIWVRDIALKLGLSLQLARTSAVVYGLLPHTLVLPHQLSSEAIYVPLLVGSFALLARDLGGGAMRCIPSALLTGVATLVRPVTLLWPLLCALLLPSSLRGRLAYLAAALAPLALWMGFMFAMTGHLSLGNSGHDLGHNLYDRSARIAARLPDQEPPLARAERDGRTLSVLEYAAFAADHPLATLAHTGRDLVVFAAKSGLERVLLDYFEISPASRELLQGEQGWRSWLERDGAVRALQEVFRRSPVLASLSALGGVVFGVFMLLASAGALSWVVSSERASDPAMRALRLIVMVFPLYVFAASQAVDAAQSRHRAPAEFALAILAVTGVAALRSTSRGARDTRRSTAP
jgi:hypothetical protein